MPLCWCYVTCPLLAAAAPLPLQQRRHTPRDSTSPVGAVLDQVFARSPAALLPRRRLVIRADMDPPARVPHTHTHTQLTSEGIGTYMADPLASHGTLSYEAAGAHPLVRTPPHARTHFVADHFSPLVVGQLPCREALSSTPWGVRLHRRQHAPCVSGTHTTGWGSNACVQRAVRGGGCCACMRPARHTRGQRHAHL
jgi:hypothetical protein